MADKVVFSLKLFSVFLVFFTLSCQTFPPGENIKEAQRTYVEDQITETAEYEEGYPSLSTVDLYLYFAMCKASWRERDSYKNTVWDLDYFYDEETNTLVLTIIENNILHIIFRSSQFMENSTDLKSNLKVQLRKDDLFPEGNIRAHKGFLEKYHSIRMRLLERVEKYGTHRPIVLVGHSGGGALAALAFMDLKTLYGNNNIVGITFGMPRVFNWSGAAWFKDYRDNFLRIVNGRDAIPNLPPALFGYRHVGRLIRIGRRPFYIIFSSYDHFRGYYSVLKEMLIREGYNPSKVLSFSLDNTNN